MSSVPKSRREKHDFLANHKLKQIRKRITELAINDFGYDKEKLEKQIQRFSEHIGEFEGKEETIRKKREKNVSFYADFVEEETIITRQILRDAVFEFELGNSIFPSGEALLVEYCERRKHLNNAIGHLNCLKQELCFIAETLPGDKNRYDNITAEIKEEIALIKGVRKAANKYLAGKNKEKPENNEAG